MIVIQGFTPFKSWPADLILELAFQLELFSNVLLTCLVCVELEEDLLQPLQHRLAEAGLPLIISNYISRFWWYISSNLSQTFILRYTCLFLMISNYISLVGHIKLKIYLRGKDLHSQRGRPAHEPPRHSGFCISLHFSLLRDPLEGEQWASFLLCLCVEWNMNSMKLLSFSDLKINDQRSSPEQWRQHTDPTPHVVRCCIKSISQVAPKHGKSYRRAQSF